jgi:hypothetical protein
LAKIAESKAKLAAEEAEGQQKLLDDKARAVGSGGVAGQTVTTAFTYSNGDVYEGSISRRKVVESFRRALSYFVRTITNEIE